MHRSYTAPTAVILTWGLQVHATGTHTAVHARNACRLGAHQLVQPAMPSEPPLACILLDAHSCF